MIRKLKIQGCALAAVAAVLMVAASSASGGVLTTETGVAATLVGAETGATLDNSFTTFSGPVHCPGSTLTGHKAAVTPHENVQHGAASITLTPHYVNCVTKETEGSPSLPTTIDMNGCDYLLTIGSVTGGGYGADIHRVCPENKFIQLTVFSSSSHALKLCTLSATTTTPISELHLNNAGGGIKDIALVGTLTSIEVHKSGLCGSATDKAGSQHIDMTVKGFVGSQIGISISG
ncbi:MAG TPA: hypothetical protein VFM94_09365 [Solirubrobacterales bacterium]|nr:hypothetical protein [Solirubrobacterales bacterium]